MLRINALLRQAQANLRTYHEMPDDVDQHRWSALYLPLSLLLGKHLTNCLREAGELEYDFRYVGQGYEDNARRNDHVVPLKCIIRQLTTYQDWPQGNEGIALLRAFMRENLVMANITTMLDGLLPPNAMPNNTWWQPLSAEFSLQQKQTALWGRYSAAELGLVMPWIGEEDFVRVRRH